KIIAHIGYVAGNSATHILEIGVITIWPDSWQMALEFYIPNGDGLAVTGMVPAPANQFGKILYDRAADHNLRVMIGAISTQNIFPRFLFNFMITVIPSLNGDIHPAAKGQFVID